MDVKFVSEKFVVYHFKEETRHAKEMGYIEITKQKTGINIDVPVLIEYVTSHKGMKFVFHGHYFAADMLAKNVGGAISHFNYWILYDETGGMYGLRHGFTCVDDINVSEIQEEIGKWLA